MRCKEAIDEILSAPYNFDLVKPCIESKAFGIGVEAYTVGFRNFQKALGLADSYEREVLSKRG